MPDRADIIRAATEKARASFESYVELQNRQLVDLYARYAADLQTQLLKAEREGKIPIGSSTRLNDYVKGTIPGFRKAISGSIKRGISNAVDWGFKTQILSMNAAGIAQKIIQLGTSFIGADGQVVRWDAAKETFVQSVWSRMNTDAVNAVMAWKPGGLAFSDRVWSVTWDTQRQIMSVIQRGLVQGTSAADLSKELRKFLVQPETLRGKALAGLEPGVGVYRSSYKNAMRLARTELNRAFNEATVRYAGRKSWIDGFIWRAGAYEPCENICAPNVDRFFDRDDAPLLPAHPHCLPAGMIVRPCGDTLGTTRRYYSGELVTIETASHKKLTCTPNHPVLTREGWVAANQIQVGRNLVSCLRSNGRTERVNDIQEPARIEDIVGAFEKRPVMQSVPVEVAGSDFHGDGVGSKVATVTTDRFLRRHLNVDGGQVVLQESLVGGDVPPDEGAFDSGGASAFSFPRHVRASHGLMGGICDMRFDFRWELAHLQEMCFAVRANRLTSIPEILDDGGRTDAVLLGEVGARLASLIKRNKFGGRQLRPSQRAREDMGLFGGAETYPSRLQSSADRLFADAEVSGQRVGKLPAIEAFDDLVEGERDGNRAALLLANGCVLDVVVRISTSSFSGFVYNLNTTTSYYFVDGIATHNCMCRLDLHIEGDPLPGQKGFVKSNTNSGAA